MQTSKRLPQLLRSSGLLKRAHAQYFQRLYATTVSESERMSTTLDDSSGIAVMTMHDKPANLFSLEYLTDLNNSLEKLHADKSCKGLVVTSGLRGIYSGGIEITEIYQPKQERFNLFWGMLQESLMKLYGSRLATVAAINGHSPAGGCMIAMCCDYRIMASGKYTIGLNETKLGIMAPTWFSAVMTATIGQRQTDSALQLGTLFSADHALRIGLVDEVCDEKQIVDKAKEQLSQWLLIPEHAREITKLYLRQPVVDKLMTRRQEDIDFTLNMIDRPSVQIPLGKYLENLKKKKNIK